MRTGNSVFVIHLATRFATRVLTSQAVFGAPMEHRTNVRTVVPERFVE